VETLAWGAWVVRGGTGVGWRMEEPACGAAGGAWRHQQGASRGGAGLGQRAARGGASVEQRVARGGAVVGQRVEAPAWGDARTGPFLFF
jgi:hypothetical protein